MLGSEDFIALNEILYPTIMQLKRVPDQNFHENVFANTIINLQKSVKNFSRLYNLYWPYILSIKRNYYRFTSHSA